MHELSIAMALLDLIKQTAAQNQLKNVTQITIQAGELTAIEPDNLRFCFDQFKINTIAANAELEIQIIPLQIYCSNCQKEFPINKFEFICPLCKTRNVQVIKGEELCLYQLKGDQLGN